MRTRTFSHVNKDPHKRHYEKEDARSLPYQRLQVSNRRLIDL